MKCQVRWITNWNQDCGEKINNLRYASDTTLWQKVKKEGTKSESREWKSWLKTQHSKTKIMASGPITSWQIDGEKVEAVTDFIFLGSKITVDGDSSHEIKWRLLHGRKVTTNLNHVLKSRDITLLTKVHLVKSINFPVAMHGCESWTIQKAERWRVDAFELWFWRRLMSITWATRRSNQSILKEINPEFWKDWCWSWNSNPLATWCKMLSLWKMFWCWKRLRAEGEGCGRGWDG